MIGKISAPSASLAVPTVPGVSLSVVSASTNPWSRVTWVSLPVSESMAATGLGAGAADATRGAVSSSLPHAAAERPVVATSAMAAMVLRLLLEKLERMLKSHPVAWSLCRGLFGASD